MLVLRDYQENMVSRCREALRSYRRVLLVSPTGSGKTAIAAFMLGTAAQRGKRSWFVVPKREILLQSAIAFEDQGIQHGLIAAGFPDHPHRLVQVCSMDTVRRRDLEDPDMLIVDEAHHAAAKSWAAFIDRMTKTKIIGLTASAMRLDGKGLGNHFDVLLEGPTPSWLMQNGHLSGYRAFSPPSPDLSSVHRMAGDYNQDELGKAVDQPKLVGDAIDHYQRIAPGRKALIFAVNILHSRHLCEYAKSRGIAAMHIDGEMGSYERDMAIADFRAGRLQILSNCRLVEEGFNLPGIEVVIDCAPTLSLARVMQRWGRGLRVKPDGSKLIILDHANNIRQHGLPDDEREWKLTYDRKKKPTVASPKVCSNCFAVMRGSSCQECGKQTERAPIEIPDAADGELVEVDVLAMRRERKAEQSSARSLEALREIARQRGYHNRWADHIWAARQRKSAS